MLMLMIILTTPMSILPMRLRGVMMHLQVHIVLNKPWRGIGRVGYGVFA